MCLWLETEVDHPLDVRFWHDDGLFHVQCAVDVRDVRGDHGGDALAVEAGGLSGNDEWVGKVPSTNIQAPEKLQ